MPPQHPYHGSLLHHSASHNIVRVRGLISKFSVGCGRGSNDRQFFYVNGRPCDPSKVGVVTWYCCRLAYICEGGQSNERCL